MELNWNTGKVSQRISPALKGDNIQSVPNAAMQGFIYAQGDTLTFRAFSEKSTATERRVVDVRPGLRAQIEVPVQLDRYESRFSVSWFLKEGVARPTQLKENEYFVSTYDLKTFKKLHEYVQENSPGAETIEVESSIGSLACASPARKARKGLGVWNSHLNTLRVDVCDDSGVKATVFWHGLNSKPDAVRLALAGSQILFVDQSHALVQSGGHVHVVDILQRRIEASTNITGTLDDLEAVPQVQGSLLQEKRLLILQTRKIGQGQTFFRAYRY